MALLKPNTTYTVNGVTVNEKIIPDGTRWKNAAKAKKAGFSASSLYKKQRKLTQNTGAPLSITIHNTNDIPRVEDDSEQYTRATYNENMGSARVHFYVDDRGAWQNLKAGTGLSTNDPEGSAEVGWHAGDGSSSTGGNMTSIGIEIIMNDNAEHDAAARDNGARLTAWLLQKHGLSVDNVVTHTFWVNKSAGRTYADKDEQCTRQIRGKKWCPSYIFGSTRHDTALANWKAFKQLVQRYYGGIDSAETDSTDTPQEENAPRALKVGDLVHIDSKATYYSGKAVPAWVLAQNWYIKAIRGDRVVIDENEKHTNAICSPIHAKYLHHVLHEQPIFQPYLIKVAANVLTIYRDPHFDSPKTGVITDRGVYTIVEEHTVSDTGSWGKLKSGIGWIPLDFTKRL